MNAFPITVLASPPERIATGLAFSEGPVWLPQHHKLLLTDIPRNTIMAWSEAEGLHTWLAHSHFAIGLALHPDGRILACEHSTRSLAAYALQNDGSPGARTVLARSWQGCVLNSTNDVIAAPDGSIFFTDPPFGVRMTENGALAGYEQAMELPGCWVFRATADMDAPEPVLQLMHRPNGLCLDATGSRLYVSDSSQQFHHIEVYDIGPGWTLSGRRVHAVMPAGVPDGMQCDVQGRLWVAGGDGIYVWDAEGAKVAHIPLPEMITNLCLGGGFVYATGVNSVWRARLADF